MAREKDSHRALGAVQQHGRRRQPLAPGTQYVRRPDAARSDLPQVAGPEGAGQQHAEGNRAEQIARGDQQIYRHGIPPARSSAYLRNSIPPSPESVLADTETAKRTR